MQLEHPIIRLLNFKKNTFPTIHQFSVEDSFSFAKEIVEQGSNSYMSSLDVDSRFTNIQLEETINICTKSINNQNIDGLNKSEFKELLSLTTK